MNFERFSHMKHRAGDGPFHALSCTGDILVKATGSTSVKHEERRGFVHKNVCFYIGITIKCI